MNIKRFVATGFAAAVVVAGMAAPAFAGTSYPGGGEWYHNGGGEGSTIHSNYLHPKNCHTATAKNANGKSDKTTASKTYWAYSSVPGTDDTDYAYWNNEC